MTVAGAAGEQGLVPTTDRFGVALADIVRCRACGHMQLARMPAEPDLAEAYGEAASEDYIEEEDGQRATARSVLSTLERHAPRGALLDVGCWVGFLLAEAQQRGWRASGVEPSEFASRHARERLGVDVQTAGLFDVELPEAAFEAVFLGDVIEHLPDPGAALDRITAALSEDGILAMTLPDAGSRVARVLGRRWWSVIPTHLQYFTRDSVAVLLGRHGYQVVGIDSSPKAFSIRYYLGRIGGYSPGTGRRLVRVAEKLRVADRIWSPDFGDRMLVVARRANGYCPGEYWTRRLESERSLRGTGHILYSEGYNRWLYRAKRRALRRALGDAVAQTRALDAGCGSGWVVGQLTAMGASVDGFDIAAPAVERLRAQSEGGDFFQLALGEEPIPRPDASYDLVTALDVAYHVVDDQRWENAVAEMARVLRPGGRLMVTDSLGPVDRRASAHVRFRSAQRWRDAASDAGLRLESTGPLYRWLSRDPGRGGFSRLPGRVRGALEYGLETLAPRSPHMRWAILRKPALAEPAQATGTR